MAEKLIKDKAKKLFKKVLITYVAPSILALTIIVGAAGVVVEIPNMLAEKITEFFSNLFGSSDDGTVELEEYTLSQLLEYFETKIGRASCRERV